MHELAKKWDKDNHNKATHHVVEDGKFIAINRPCDWCGKINEKGYIHKECSEKERDFWFDILY